MRATGAAGIQGVGKQGLAGRRHAIPNAAAVLTKATRKAEASDMPTVNDLPILAA
jgi:hypothetical protein